MTDRTEARPLKIKVADDYRAKITDGTYRPGDLLPSIPQIRAEYGVSRETVQAAITMLEQEHLVVSRQGKGTYVLEPVRRVVRDSSRHQAEKDLALASEEERRRHGETEDDLGVPLSEVEFDARFTIIAADDMATIFGIDADETLLRQEYERSARAGGRRLSYSVSYVPTHLVQKRPDFMIKECEPWPGGAMHKFHELDIEPSCIVDEVIGITPTEPERERWQLDQGVYLLCVRRITYDASGRVVEVSDAQYPTDRTQLRFTTELKPWSK
jgi:GntR family transcriptional regulator